MESNTQANFDHFTIDLHEGVFHKNGNRLKLRPKEVAVLWSLIQHPGELVSKDQIIHEVWHDFPASDESIARCISVIKAHLRLNNPGSENLIKTEYGRGYKFIGKVLPVPDKRNRKPKSSVKPTTVGDISSTQVLTCGPGTTVLDLAILLNTHQKSSILITIDNKPVGIWTEADFLALNLADKAVLNKPICELVHQTLISIEQSRPITEAVLLMRNNGIRHIAVVNKNGFVFGMVSQSDIIYSHGVEAFMTVKDVKSIAYRKPLVITDNLKVTDVIDHMRSKQTDILVIHLPDRPLFTFTEREVVELIASQSLNLFLTEIDFPTLVTINENTSILVARQLMDIKKIKHLAVLDDESNFVKILCLSDLLAEIEHSYVELIEQIIEENQIVHDQEESNRLLANAMRQTAGMVIITDQHGDIAYVNEAFEKVTGYQLNEIKGKNPRILSTGVISKSQFKQMWETLTAGKTWKGELCNQKKTGEHYWVLCSITPIFNELNEIQHFISVEEDITKHKETENRLHEIEQRLYEMVDDSSVMIWESCPNGKVSFLNKCWLDFTGRELQEQMGNAWAEQLHPEDLEKYLDEFQKALVKRSSFCLDHRLKNANGDYRWVMNSGLPRFNEQGEFTGFRGTCVDITERKIREIEALNLAYWGYKPELW